MSAWMLAQGVGGVRDEAQIARALHRVVLRSRGADSDPIARLTDWLSAHAPQLLPGGEGNLIFLALAAVAAFVLVRLGWVLARGARRGGRVRTGAAGDSGPEAVDVARELVARARVQRGRGDRREALRSLLHALVLVLGGRGALEFRPAWTLRELIDRGAPREEARALLVELVRQYEPKDFGRAPVTDEDLDRLEQACSSALGVAS